jgi:hypothetical protein
MQVYRMMFISPILSTHVMGKKKGECIPDVEWGYTVLKLQILYPNLKSLLYKGKITSLCLTDWALCHEDVCGRG